MPLVWE